MIEYRTRTGKRGVVCVCSRRALVTPAGLIFRHADMRAPKTWCAYGGQPVEALDASS